MIILFAWYMVDSLLNLILEGSGKDFIRRAELDVRDEVGIRREEKTRQKD